MKHGLLLLGRLIALTALVTCAPHPPVLTPCLDRAAPIEAADAGQTISVGASDNGVTTTEINDWPYRCLALKVVQIESAENVSGYYLPIRCVPEMNEYPGSRFSDGGCVPGCVTIVKTACFDSNCEVRVREP